MVARTITENDILPVLRKIDSYYIDRKITSDEADDLTNCVTWVIGKTAGETNVQHVVSQLRGYKEFIPKEIVSSVINEVRKALG